MARQLLLNFVIAIVWALLNNAWTVTSFFTGYIIGFVVLFLLRRFFPGGFYGRRVVAVLVLAGIFLRELLLSNIAVIKLVVKPKLTLRPGIVALPTRLKSPWEITVLANLITLTPGTLTVDVARDHSTLYIHALDIEDAEEVVHSIKETFETRIMEVTQ